MPAEFFGNVGLTELPSERVRDPQRGNSIVRRWRGTRAQVEAFWGTLIGSNYRIEEQAGDTDLEMILRVTIPGLDDGSDPTDAANVVEQWTAPGEVSQIDLFTLPQFGALDAAKKTAIREYRNSLATLTPQAPPTYTSGTDEANFVAELAAGQTSILRTRGTLKYVATYPPEATIVDHSIYREFTFTRSDIITNWEPPVSIQNQMPTGANEGLWLCVHASVAQTEKGGWVVTLEWVHSPTGWSVFYPAATL